MTFPDADSPAVPALDAELATAQAELQALEQLVAELPQIYEAKFRQGVEAVVQVNRQLAGEQAALREACAGALPAAAATSPGRSIRLGALWEKRFAPWALVAVAALAFGLWLTRVRQRRAERAPVAALSAPAVDASMAAAVLVLRAQGTSWVEVQDLGSREVLFIGELQAGQQRTVRFRQALRLRSGRPDLLTVQLDGQRPQPFDQNQGLDWRTFRRAGA
jgi:phage tail protein X